jgi:superfamily II DNA/RNA helicase
MEQDPDDPSKRALIVSFDLPSKIPGYLVRIGRNVHTNDIILPDGWSRNDQACLDVHPTTEEILLHDISSRGNTSLCDLDGTEQIHKIPRQCVVLLDRVYIFRMGRAEFILKSRKAQDQVLGEKRRSFLRQPVPEDYNGTYEEALDHFRNFEIQSARSSVYNTRMQTPLQPEPGNEIRYTKVKRLGGGSQGTVDEVVDMHTGKHYACKVIKYKPIPELGIDTEKAFKLKFEAEVYLLRKLCHVSSFLTALITGRAHELVRIISFHTGTSKVFDSERTSQPSRTFAIVLFNGRLHTSNPERRGRLRQ